MAFHESDQGLDVLRTTCSPQYRAVGARSVEAPQNCHLHAVFDDGTGRRPSGVVAENFGSAEARPQRRCGCAARVELLLTRDTSRLNELVEDRALEPDVLAE